MGPIRWIWQLLPEDVELIETTRAAHPESNIGLLVEIRGIAKVLDDRGNYVDVVPIKDGGGQIEIEVSQWESLLKQIGYDVPPSTSGLAGISSLGHSSWQEASNSLQEARSHHRAGEDYSALRQCLSSLEGLIDSPYDKKSWEGQLSSLPNQKADAIAELFSGLATFCNRVGHHRDRNERDVDGNLVPMPLDHWEADLVLGAAQFILAYAMRLRATEILGLD